MRVPNWFRITAALWAAVFLFIAFTLPAATRRATGLDGAHVRRGAFHVHTTRSDGGGTREDVARAAAAAGLDFVILTDHGDGTAEPAPPAYLHNVLVIDGVEVTTLAGHYAAFGLARAPYPLGGPAYAVIEDVARLGGFGVAAHPDSVKPELRWRDWTSTIDGLEWINGDSAWRDERPMTLARGIVDYLWRPAPALAGLVERPSRLLQRLDDLSRSRRTVALAAADAHARLPLTDDAEPRRASWAVPAPSYKKTFTTFSNIVDVGTPPTGDAAVDAAALVRSIRAGRVATAMQALAEPSDLQFWSVITAADVTSRWPMGSRLTPTPMTFGARTSQVIKSGHSLVRLELRRDGRIVATADGPSLSYRADDSRGVWRVEATLAHRPDVPWLLSNPIVVADSASTPAASPPPAGADPVALSSLDITMGEWAIEKHPACAGTLEQTAGAQTFSYRLAGGVPSGQYAAASRTTGNTDSWDAIVLTAHADGPSRVWVQLRLSDSSTGQRWGRSIYLDEQSRTYRLPISQFERMEPTGSVSRPNIVQVRAVLLVADTVNTAPGGSGRVVVERLELSRSRQLVR